MSLSMSPFARKADAFPEQYTTDMLPDRDTSEVSVIEFFAGWLITLSVPAAIVWIPIIDRAGFGTVTAFDVILLLLWPISYHAYFADKETRRRVKLAVWLPLLALLLSVSVAMGAIAFSSSYPDPPGVALIEFFAMMKRFGFASILALAIPAFVTKKLHRRLTISLAATFVGMTLFAVFPSIYEALPVARSAPIVEGVTPVRGVGAVTNPNDYAYIAVLLSLVLLSITLGKANSAQAKTVVRAIATWSLLTAIFLSASRSGVTGLGSCIVYVLLAVRISPTRRVFLILAVVALSFGALQYGFENNQLFYERVTTALTEGTQERNLAARLTAQRIALATSLEHPFGTGFSNMALATAERSNAVGFAPIRGSDNIYVDVLLGAGIVGLCSLLLIFVVSWKAITHLAGNTPRGVLLRGSIVAAMTFGMATVAPASSFVAPFFFTAVGVSAFAKNSE